MKSVSALPIAASTPVESTAASAYHANAAQVNLRFNAEVACEEPAPVKLASFALCSLLSPKSVTYLLTYLLTY